MNYPNKNSYFQPILYSVLIAVGVVIGMFTNYSGTSKSGSGSSGRIQEVLNLIDNAYVDTVDFSSLQEDAISHLLKNLDPHSVFIPASELESVNEPLEGNFEGIGIEFNIVEDTIRVVGVIPGGPSYELGIQNGDRIVELEGKVIAGIGLKNSEVIKMLKGKKGTKVKLGVFRRGHKQLLQFTITRGTVPIYSLDASYMIEENTGYVKISRFSSTTHDEYKAAISRLKKEGLQNLVLDLRDNPGGYLSAATRLADEFLGDKKLIVYTEGRNQKRKSYMATSGGSFENGRLIILIDEGSASASEILSGAIQDWDRGLVIGRRTFGKGLVQEPFSLSDGSGIRLTVARYFTPTGRSIQKSYSAGYNEYQKEIFNRYRDGELENDEVFVKSDSIEYQTPSGRKVYGGGGIIPDVFVPLDTSGNTTFRTAVYSKNLISRFVYSYLDRNKKEFKKFKSERDYEREFEVSDQLYSEFLRFALPETGKINERDIIKSSEIIKHQIKSVFAKQLWGNNAYYFVLNKTDATVQKALESIPNYISLLNRK